jgi:hypothetical protein
MRCLVENEAFAVIPIKFEVFWDILLFRVNITAAVLVDLLSLFGREGLSYSETSVTTHHSARRHITRAILLCIITTLLCVP